MKTLEDCMHEGSVRVFHLGCRNWWWELLAVRIVLLRERQRQCVCGRRVRERQCVCGERKRESWMSFAVGLTSTLLCVIFGGNCRHVFCAIAILRGTLVLAFLQSTSLLFTDCLWELSWVRRWRWVGTVKRAVSVSSFSSVLLYSFISQPFFDWVIPSPAAHTSQIFTIYLFRDHQIGRMRRLLSDDSIIRKLGKHCTVHVYKAVVTPLPPILPHISQP